MTSLICIKLKYVKKSPYVRNDFVLRTLLVQTVLTTAAFVKAAVTSFDFYGIVLINNKTYVLRKDSVGLYKSLIVSMTTYHIY